MPTSEELLELAERCAAKLELDGKLRHVPSFSDTEDQCEEEYEELLQAIHDDELFSPVDIQRQEQLVDPQPPRTPPGSGRSERYPAPPSADRPGAARGGAPAARLPSPG